MPLVPRTAEELLLTSAQSLFAVALLANFRFNVWEAVVLLIPFIVTAFFPSTHVRWIFALCYIGLAVLLLLARADRRRQLLQLIRSRGRSGIPQLPSDVPVPVSAERG